MIGWLRDLWFGSTSKHDVLAAEAELRKAVAQHTEVSEMTKRDAKKQENEANGLAHAAGAALASVKRGQNGER